MIEYSKYIGYPGTEFSRIFLFPDNSDFKSLNVWLEYNGLSFADYINKFIEYIYDLYNVHPIKIMKGNDRYLAIAQYDSYYPFKKRIEVLFYDYEISLIEVDVIIDFKLKDRHKIIDNIVINNMSEIYNVKMWLNSKLRQMKFYHRTKLENWKKIQEEGILWGIGESYRYTYLSPYDFGESYGPILLEVEYDPVGIDETQTDNYKLDCPRAPPVGNFLYLFQLILSM